MFCPRKPDIELPNRLCQLFAIPDSFVLRRFFQVEHNFVVFMKLQEFLCPAPWFLAHKRRKRDAVLEPFALVNRDNPDCVFVTSKRNSCSSFSSPPSEICRASHLISPSMPKRFSTQAACNSSIKYKMFVSRRSPSRQWSKRDRTFSQTSSSRIICTKPWSRHHMW